MPQTDKEHNRELKRTVKKVRKFLNDQQFYPRANVMLDRAVLALVSKSVNVAQAVVCLIDAGLPEEAFGLSRTLVEIALNLRFVTNRYSERRARRFAHYSAKWKLELIRRAVKHFKAQDAKGQLQPKYTKAQLRKMMPDYKRMVRLARKYPKRFGAGWSGKNAREMALEADGHDKIDGKPVVWEFDYDWIYAWTSQYVHATAVSSRRRSCRHHRHLLFLCRRLRLPLRPLPRLALVEGGHRQLPTDQEGLSRGMLDVFCSCPNGTPRTRTPWQAQRAIIPSMASILQIPTQDTIHRIQRIQAITIVWMSVEAAVSLSAACVARSPALLAFGGDSAIELLSAAVVLWRFRAHAVQEHAERRASRIAGILLFVLAAYVVAASALTLLGYSEPKPTYLGIAILIAAAAVMPWLAKEKRRLSSATGSAALRADSAQSALCAYLSLIALAGLGANAIWHVAWADPVAALVVTPLIIWEGREAIRGKACGCC